MSEDVCPICQKPMIEGQGFYMGRVHWDCQFPNGYKDPAQEAKEALDNMKSAIQRIERKLNK